MTLIYDQDEDCSIRITTKFNYKVNKMAGKDKKRALTAGNLRGPNMEA